MLPIELKERIAKLKALAYDGYAYDVDVEKGLDEALQIIDELTTKASAEPVPGEAVDHAKVWSLRNEVDCRIEHGANSSGHLEYVRKALDKILGGGQHAN